MKENFQQALQWVLQHEGGWSDHPADPGGATQQGITLVTFRQYYGTDQTKTALRQITPEQVAHIYRVGYWDQCQCDHLPTGVDYAVFDGAVNSGPIRSATWLQMAGGARIDGLIGSATLVIIAWQDPTVIINKMLKYRLQFLQGLKSWPTFGKGWERRVEQVRRQALLLKQQKMKIFADETKS